MRIIKIYGNKKRFIDLLLLADEQENMIDKYLDRGDMFALYDDNLKGVCVVTDEGGEACELKNIAVYEKYQGKGYGKALINFISKYYRNLFNIMYVGTGDSMVTIPFYESCGFVYSHKIRNFFTDNYNQTIIENGVQLVDMVYLKKIL